jgi:hypothetical protein
MRRPIALTAILFGGLAVAAGNAAGQGFPGEYLQLKDIFQAAEDEGIKQPFVGVHTPDGVRGDLFPNKTTGVSTAPVREAAAAFLATLSPTQLMRTQFRAQDDEWRRWLNVDNGIYARRGTPLAEMTDDQKESAMALVSASLSVRGLAQSKAIMLTDQALKELNPEMEWIYGPELYYFTVMGTPSATQPWGWQLDGHHLIVNYFVLGDQVVMTPSFWGGEPTRSMHGSTKGNEVLQDQQDRGLALMQSLSAAQRTSATLKPDKTGADLQAGAQRDNLALDYAGLRARNMSSGQRRALAGLIESYVGLMDDGHARVKMDEVIAHLDETWFSWVGRASDDAVFYYRIHSPVILIEFDHQQPVGTTAIHSETGPVRDHIHTIVRTPNGNDYGKDLLRQHLATAH